MADAELIRARFRESAELKAALLEDAHVAFTDRLAARIADALRGGGKVMFCGNGGSAADATHLAAEFVGRYTMERAPLAALSLTDNGSSISAIGNDYAYAETFARQVRGLGAAGDVVVGLSTSGTSPNVVAALAAAAEIGCSTAAMTGRSGGALVGLTDLCLCVPSESTARIQECSMLVGHTVCELVERALFAGPA